MGHGQRHHRNFYPRPPRGGRRCARPLIRVYNPFLSTPSARRATKYFLGQSQQAQDFYPRPPRGGRRRVAKISALRVLFLSTPSARRATSFLRVPPSSITNFYPRPPRGGRRGWFRIPAHSSRFLSTPSARRATAKTETKSLFSYKLYNILHEFRRALIYNGSKNDPNHAKRLKNPVRRCRKNAENSPFAPGRKTQNNSRPSCSKGG